MRKIPFIYNNKRKGHYIHSLCGIKIEKTEYENFELWDLQNWKKN